MTRHRIEVGNNELLTARDLRRDLNTRLASLEGGEVSKLVLTKHGKMIAVIVTVEEYARMRGAEFNRG